MTSKKLPNSKSLTFQVHLKLKVLVLSTSWKNLKRTLTIEIQRKRTLYVSIHDGRLKNRKTSDSYHIAGTRKVIVEQTLQSHPTNRPILIVPEAVVVHGEEIASKCVVCDLHLHAVINSKKQCKYDLGCSMFY